MTLPSGKIWVRRLDGRVDSSAYTSLLKHHVKPYLKSELGEGNYFLQQDNCKVHVYKETKKSLNSAGIKTFEWPSINSLEGFISAFVDMHESRDLYHETMCSLRKISMN
jgi:hypothetical protein